MTTRPVGVEAIAEAAREAVPAPVEQLELLAPTRFAPGSQQHAEMVERTRRGRPLNARNIATRKAIEVVRRLFGDPMVESARQLLHTPESLAAELNCTKLEAFDRLEKIRADLRRFMYAPLAAVDGQGNVVAPTFNMMVGGAVQGADGRPPWVYEGGPIIEQNQALPAPANDVSDDAASDDEAT